MGTPTAPQESPDGRWAAPNYNPLPVTLTAAEGSWVTDDEGRRLLDLLSAYSALNFGHRHPALVAAAKAQLDLVTLTSRAFGNDRLPLFCERLAALCGQEMVLPMNTGAEAVETAIKAARRWGMLRRGVPDGEAEIIVCDGNFHGRTTTIVGFSTDPEAREGFGPFGPGFTVVPFGDAAAMAAAVTPRTVAVLVEPIQGEAGVRIPPDGYLRAVRELCDDAGILLVADEIQSGLGRTGRTFACDHEGVRPDAYLLGKALGGGIVAVSAVVGSADMLGVLTAGRHGSTFGGNPLSCAVGLAVLDLLESDEPQRQATAMGEVLACRLAALPRHHVTAVRARGLWAGVDLAPSLGPARALCEELMRRRVLVKDTHGSTIRIAPPLNIQRHDLDWACDRLIEALDALAERSAR
ncbi:MAG TPA: ornithine--oxo-acid transaminase [Acidimicrobiales bacterium]|nr:ornithine--oxo-acid transaminase [Acidimicrobiales bacterium]